MHTVRRTLTVVSHSKVIVCVDKEVIVFATVLKVMYDGGEVDTE